MQFIKFMCCVGEFQLCMHGTYGFSDIKQYDDILSARPKQILNSCSYCLPPMGNTFIPCMVSSWHWYMSMQSLGCYICILIHCFYKHMFRGLVKILPLLQGARYSLFSEAGIAAPASCCSYCILIYSRAQGPRVLNSFAAYSFQK